ncbi:hypothetical protein A8F94_21865 [Bacillus sp. FJAT-27225]|uniref:TPM domain-containing protein n=1 Tax=Bacillus sp. FJAT-27225 TaxID=1743144 RepID=UPI00080C2CEE|nr:TPM domain-containing protein [Bacillus sp. FJAT-27225]OCA81524.1 hypothetical protein A8F94_21865 [Bacillus sp. FJAT-27225]
MIRRKAAGILALLVLLLVGSATILAAEEIPAPRGDIYVQDVADVLSPAEEQQIRGWGRQIQSGAAGAQIAVLTVDTIGGRDIEGYANEAFRKYRLGQAGEDNGILLVLAMQEKRIRIEVGYGLEGIIPDGKAGRILDSYAIPSLQAGRPNEAVMNTYQALAYEVMDSFDASSNPIPQPISVGQGEDTGMPNWLFILLIAGLIILDMVFFRGTFTFLILSMIGRGGGGGGGSIGGGGGSSGGGGASRGW